MTDISMAGAELRKAMFRAVGARVGSQGVVSSDLSGGLDSTTVTALAASFADVRAMTIAIPGVDDAEIATAAAAKLDRVEQELFEGYGMVLPYADLDQMPAFDGPTAFTAVAGRERWWLTRIAESGASLHFGGDGGDAVLSALPAYLADLVAPGLLTALWRHAGGWARLRHQATGRLVRAAMALRRQSYKAALRDTACRLTASDTAATGWAQLISWFPPSAVASWTTREVRQLVAADLVRHAEEHPEPLVPGPFGVGDTTAWQALIRFGQAQRIYRQFAHRLGVNHHVPFLDDGVVRACWSVPARVRTTPEQAKPLLRHAMAGVVPDFVLQRRTKGDYSNLAYQGLRQHHDVLRDLLTDSRLASLGLIDEAEVISQLRQGRAGVPIRLGAFDAVIGAEVWLRSLDRKDA